jgi:hypothetical protein
MRGIENKGEASIWRISSLYKDGLFNRSGDFFADSGY